jgi:hypothetical protein
MTVKAKRAALLGFDCAIPKRLEALVAEGALPNFKKFMETGSYMTEGYNLPTVTPPSWATICTGAYPRTHGVEDYYYYVEGRSLEHKQTVQAFGSEILTAQTIWDRWDKDGKKCIVVNYPMAWPSKMKNGVMVMGEGISPAETRWMEEGNAHREFLASESVISSDFFPMGVQASFDKARGWANLPECDEPLEFTVDMAFKESMSPLENQTWYGLCWESGDDGFDTFALCPEKDYSKAFFTITTGKWSAPVVHDFTVKEDGRNEKSSSSTSPVFPVIAALSLLPKQQATSTSPMTSSPTTSVSWASCTAFWTWTPWSNWPSSTPTGSCALLPACSPPMATGTSSTCTPTPSTGSTTAGWATWTARTKKCATVPTTWNARFTRSKTACSAR